MGPLPIASTVIALFLPVLAHAAPPAPRESAFDAAAGELLIKAGAAFTSHKQGSPTLESAVPLPAAPKDPAQAGPYEALKTMLAAASRVQEGCQAPCADAAEIALYRGKVEMIAQQKLRLGPAGVKAAVDNYLPKGLPRIRTSPAGGRNEPESRLLEAEVVSRMLASADTAATLRPGLNRKALDLAAALGTTKEIKADAQGFVVMPSGQRSRMTAAELAALNRIPAAQATYLKRLASAPPPPTAQQKSDGAMRDADKLIEENPGRVRESLNYWKAESQNESGNKVWRAYSYFNRGLLSLSGLADVEESSARLGYASASSDVTTRRTVWEGFKAVGNAGLFAANFVGLSGGAQVLKGAKAIDNPVVVQGVERLSKAAASKVAARSAEVSETLTTALATGGKRNYKAATEALNAYAKKNLGGVIRVEQGGKVGQADFIAKEMKIAYSPLVGESHEFAHAGQMFINRANALEITAQKAGKAASALSPAEVEQAMALASRFEKGYYMHHEAQALRSSGILGLFPGKNYGTKLAQNGTELTQAMLGAPNFSFTRGQKIFGALSGLGDSQAKIAAGIVPVFNAPVIKDLAGEALDITATGANAYLPDPVSGGGR